MKISTVNIEGVKSNIPYLIEQSQEEQIFCISEHWLWDFEKTTVENILPKYKAYVRCTDTYDPISCFKSPRGRGGVAILWPESWSDNIVELPDGNERVVAIELRTIGTPLCIISVYMPTMDTNSVSSYSEHLDIVHSILSKYRSTHAVIVAGDFNGTILDTRNNVHDQRLKSFIMSEGLFTSVDLSTEKTFFHHSGNGSSQIDYILCTDQLLLTSTKIGSQTYNNSSAHVLVTGTLSTEVTSASAGRKKNVNRKVVKKYYWDKVNDELFNKLLKEKLEKTISSDQSVNEKLEIITETLNAVTQKSVPSKVLRLQGPRFRITPELKSLLNISKLKHLLWVQQGSPCSDHYASVERKTAKRNVRTYTRKRHAAEKTQLMNDIMSNPDSKTFHKLIKQSQGGTSQNTEILVIDGCESTDTVLQRKSLAHFYEDLAVPKSDSNFDEYFSNLNKLQLDIINQLNIAQDDNDIKPITESEVIKAVGNLNNGKSADEFGISSEHLKTGKDVLVPSITVIFNEILTTGNVPEVFKSGIITPVHKKGKDPKRMDNYRGITVTSIIGKLFEYVLLGRMSEISSNQSELQFGFTSGLSPNMASLLMSEAVVDSKLEGRPLYVATLDSQKAFDVVSHEILLSKLHETGIHRQAWTVIQSMYTGLTSRVKWANDVSESFGISQGVRQGGVLSTHLYKVYINELLLDLESYSIGKYVGSTYIGCPTCADDVLLIAESSDELQQMLSLAYTYSTERRYKIHPIKSAVIRRSVTKAQQSKESRSDFELGQQNMNITEKTQHLGLIRAASNENQINIQERISLARRTLYKLMNTGVHGSNGINPKVGYKIYQVYVIPRLLHGLEVLPLNNTQLKALSDFHVGTLRKLQSLPQRTSIAAIFLLLGALPIEPELERRHLSLLFSIVTSGNVKLNNILERQSGMSDRAPQSFFTRCKDIVERYQLPP
ncbi:MAG: reverse transcriptase family protein, partial [Sedimenticola sp.]